MTIATKAGTFLLGDRIVNRMGYGAMQLAGPGVFGPPRDRAEAIAVLRAAVEAGVNHIDTSDFYGPHITNQIIREALHPYREDLVIVTKVGALRGEDGSWIPAQSPVQLTQAVHDNLRHLGLTMADIDIMAAPIMRIDDHIMMIGMFIGQAIARACRHSQRRLARVGCLVSPCQNGGKAGSPPWRAGPIAQSLRSRAVMLVTGVGKAGGVSDDGGDPAAGRATGSGNDLRDLCRAASDLATG